MGKIILNSKYSIFHERIIYSEIFPIYVRNILNYFVYKSKENKYMPPLSETFWAAIKKGVCDIAGKLRKLNADEKRQLLAFLRKRGDCPDKWKNIDPKKQKNILDNLRQAIARLLNPDEFAEKSKAANDRTSKRRRENGKQKAASARYNKKRKESGKQKVDNARNNARNNAINSAKRSKARREANAQAILDNKDHKEPTWPEDTLEKKAIDTVEMIDEKCGDNGFVHVFGGAWPGQDLNKAVEAECFGRGGNSHAVFIDGTNSRHKFVRYRDVSEYVELFTPYTGTNCENADRLEKRIQTKLIEMGWPQHRRMFVHAGRGTCRGTRDAKIPFPYYTGVLVCEQSMEELGIRRATTKDHARKRKRSSSSL